ncbi:MAG: hypothetical protein DHS20C11_19730 [Lysobacteraceae bacterium]|nr:MAG: hypothetical protein DHS20C11_19730 [Xanthomonadaceae bacterium]
MITRDLETFRKRFAELEPNRPATCSAALLLAPVGFSVSTESAIDNHYLDLDQPADSDLALRQHHGLADVIRGNGVPVISFDSRSDTPDAVFPNNVFGTIEGRAIIGRMCHPGRRKEAERADIRQFFDQFLRYQMIDLSQQDLVAELTGPLIIDRARGVGFCGMSDRVDEAGARAMHEAFKLKLTLCFDLAPGEYHSNVVMAVLAGRACVVHRDSIANPAVVDLMADLYPTLEIDDEEKAGFVGNCISVTPSEVYMSARADSSLQPISREFFTDHGFRVVSADVSELERAGGSLRCMVCEIY